MTDKERLEVIEAFVERGAGAVLCQNTRNVTDAIDVKTLIKYMNSGYAYYVLPIKPPVSHRWQNLILVPWTREDVPPVCWIRFKGCGDCSLICAIGNNCIETTTHIKRTFAELLSDCEYSTDLKTWHPCGKEGE